MKTFIVFDTLIAQLEMYPKEAFERDQKICLHEDAHYDVICGTETLKASEMTKAGNW